MSEPIEIEVVGTPAVVEVDVLPGIGDRGVKGDTGDTGPANTLTIGTVTTGAAGSSATATITGTAPNQTLSLAIPRGDKGDTGDTGSTGSTGPAGPANTLAVGTVTTGAAGSSAAVTITGSAPSQTINLTIPRGDAGATGSTGAQGDPGGFDTAQARNARTADYTLVLADAGKLVTMDSSSARTITVPTNASVAFAEGIHIDVARLGTGTVAIAGASGVTIRTALTASLRARWSAATLVKIGEDEWLLSGDT